MLLAKTSALDPQRQIFERISQLHVGAQIRFRVQGLGYLYYLGASLLCIWYNIPPQKPYSNYEGPTLSNLMLGSHRPRSSHVKLSQPLSQLPTSLRCKALKKLKKPHGCLLKSLHATCKALLQYCSSLPKPYEAPNIILTQRVHESNNHEIRSERTIPGAALGLVPQLVYMDPLGHKAAMHRRSPIWRPL